MNTLTNNKIDMEDDFDEDEFEDDDFEDDEQDNSHAPSSNPDADLYV